ncbi:MAG: elongation factor G [Planctomycetota bacterium]
MSSETLRSETLRNIAFVGHPSTGKTTLVDAMAHHLGASDRKGSVGDKTSISDTEPEEQERGHTLSLACVHAEKDGVRWNLIDTPGYPEFVAAATSAMFATELTVGVVSCASGVTFNLRQKMAQAAALGRARAIVVTHPDGEHADYDSLIQDLRAQVGEQCVPILMPDACGSAFSAVRQPSQTDDWHKRLQDRVMDACEDEQVLERYFETGELDGETLKQWAPRAIAEGNLIPVLCCNPDSGVGLEETVTILRRYAPKPTSSAHFGIEDEGSEDGALAGVVFDIKSDTHVGKICLARLIRGKLTSHDHVGPGKGEKVGGLFHPTGKKSRVAIEEAFAGDIVAFSKVEHLAWGQAFSTSGNEPPEIEIPALPGATVAFAVTPKSRNDEQKIGQALHKLEDEDPSFSVVHDALTHELVVRGMSDLHLKIVEERLKRRYGVEIDTALPKIAYRETITKNADGHHRHKKQSGGRGQFGECYVRVRPAAEGSGVVFADKVVGGSIPRNLIPAVEKGVLELAEAGILTNAKVVDVEVELYDGKFHAVDSDEASFKKAGANAFRDGFSKAGPVLLEPVMALEVEIPTEDAGTVLSDLTSQRRGQVTDQDSDGSHTRIRAQVPLATIQTYHRDLKSQTSGEGEFTMEFDHYARVPASEQQKVLAEIGKHHDDD